MPNTHIAMILDKSGSMHAIADDAIGSFNAFLAEQRAEADSAVLTLTLFDSLVQVLHEGVSVPTAPRLTRETYVPGGRTALLDAVGVTVGRVHAWNAAQPEGEIPDKVILCIITDGLENASREYGYSVIKKLLTQQQEAYGWEILFLAANIDVAATSERLGIHGRDAVEFSATGEGKRKAMQAMSQRVVASRRRREKAVLS